MPHLSIVDLCDFLGVIVKKTVVWCTNSKECASRVMFRPRPSCTIVPQTGPLHMSLGTPCASLSSTVTLTVINRERNVARTSTTPAIQVKVLRHWRRRDVRQKLFLGAILAQAHCIRRQVKVQCALLAQAQCIPRQVRVQRTLLAQVPCTRQQVQRTQLAQARCTPRLEQVLRVSPAQEKRTNSPAGAGAASSVGAGVKFSSTGAGVT